MSRYVAIRIIATVRDENDADEIVRVASKFGQALAETGHEAAVRVDYVEKGSAAHGAAPRAN